MSVLLIQDEPVDFPAPRVPRWRPGPRNRDLITVTLHIPRQELAALDEAVGEEKTSRSAVIRQAVGLWLRRR